MVCTTDGALNCHVDISLNGNYFGPFSAKATDSIQKFS